MSPTSRTNPDMSKPMTVGYVDMKRPWSRMMTSAGLRATDLTAMRSSSGPGFGVGRVSSSKGPPLAGEMAARWVVIWSFGVRRVLHFYDSDVGY